MRLLRELRRPDVGNPQLYRSQTLSAEPIAMCADSDCTWRVRPLASHAQTLHVTPAQSNYTRSLILGAAQNVSHTHRLQASDIGTSAERYDVVDPLGIAITDRGR